MAGRQYLTWKTLACSAMFEKDQTEAIRLLRQYIEEQPQIVSLCRENIETSNRHLRPVWVERLKRQKNFDHKKIEEAIDLINKKEITEEKFFELVNPEF